MGKLNSFTFITLDGYYKGLDEDISWHQHGEEEARWSEENLKSDNILLFGRKTYEHMVSFWPTPMALEMFPDVAEGMNKAEKIVFSRTLKNADWNNTRLFKDDLIEEIKKLKKSSDKDITILGSGEIIRQLSEAGLIDDYSIMIDPVAIGKGVSLFQDVVTPLHLKLSGSKIFKSGKVVMNYERVGA